MVIDLSRRCVKFFALLFAFFVKKIFIPKKKLTQGFGSGRKFRIRYVSN